MRITFSQLLIAFTFTSMSYAGTADGQTILDRQVDLSVRSISLEKVLKKLEKSADVKFIYSNSIIDANQKVSVNAQGEMLKAVLDRLLLPKNIRYRVVNDCIALSYDELNGPVRAPVPALEDHISVVAPRLVVTGIVSDPGGNKLVGVTVQSKAGRKGTVTDAGGRYSLEVSNANDTLIFTYIGYNRLEVPLAGKTTLDVVIEPNTQSLNDVVVVGYGTQKRKDLTGSISTISSKTIERGNPVSPLQALQGQAAGINIAKTSSLPGADFQIDIRGLGSINYDNAPLVVIDGNMGGDLNTLNPSDIASIDVLKDASATAIYGSRGANGVIIVTTKQGVAGTIRITYDAYVGMRKAAHLPNMQNAQQWAAANPNATLTSTEEAMIADGKSTDWIDLITRSAAMQTNHVLAASGGTEKVNYYFSAGYLNQDGLTRGINYKRYTLNGNISTQLNKVLRAGFNTNFAYSVQNTGSMETIRSAFRARPTGVPYYDEVLNVSESNDVEFKGYALWMGINDHQVINPLVEAYDGNQILETKLSRFNARGFVELTPMKGLSIRSSLSTFVYGTGIGDYRGTFTKTNLGTAKPTASHETQTQTSYTLDNLLTYKLNLASHSIHFTALQSAYKRRDEQYKISVKDLPYESKWHNLGSAGTIVSIGSDLMERALLSYMGRLNYGFKDKYLLTLTGRWDGASQLADGHKWGFFPSAAFAWRLVDEPFIRNLGVFSDMKLRISYGLVGNNVVPPYGTKATLANTGYDFDGSAAFGFAPASIANRELGWEKSREVDLGLNVAFLNGRIAADIDVYKRNTLDLIVEQQLPTSTGFGNVITNIGKVQNKGVEVTLNTVNLQSKDFKWRTTINFSTNRNEILELYGGNSTADVGNNLFVGQPLMANYDYKFAGIWQTADSTEALKYKQKAGTVRVIDQNNDGKITADEDRVILGSQQPKWMAGILNTFNYRNWDLSFMVYTRQGAQFRNAMISGTMGEIGKGRYNALALNYWTADNPTNDYYALNNPGPYRAAIFYQDASYWRVTDITLGYVVPPATLKRLKIGSLRVYGQIMNPFVFTNFISFDPEYNSSTYKDDLPSVNFTFGVNASF
ncbi:TonB-dependent receptor [Chitinophaga cymbidii]|uniref:SusC/RagA family TonB-linked outer membrane protein n=1 Tax=Chitinophaga cymbidii TaxID=1096750 RepID=A0A512RPG2_9BACT|nr:TonB-dependent receptor [Chitinophaga cymbidii]GEP97585.1 SusC/RagA family TonB-linked outer membrane protein [Chitinophaga cymbidii]